MAVSDRALHRYCPRMEAGSVYRQVRALSANVVALVGDGDLDALRTAGIAVNRDRAILGQQARGSGRASDGGRQPFLRGKRSLAVGQSLLVGRIGDVDTNGIVLSFADAGGINSYCLALALHFAAIGGPFIFQRVLGIEILS